MQNTRDRLVKMHLIADQSCVLCAGNEAESHAHLFCGWLKNLKEQVKVWHNLKLRDCHPSNALAEFQRKKWTNLQKCFAAAVTAGLIYHTWRARNEVIFNKTLKSPDVYAGLLIREFGIRLKMKENSKAAKQCPSLMKLGSN